MAERLSEKLEREKKLTEAQAGFRKKRSTIEQIFVLNTIIGNRLKRKRGKLYAVFVDFRKALDMVDRKRLWEKMERMGIEGKFLEMTKEIYKDTRNEVIVGDEKTETFITKKGLRHYEFLYADDAVIVAENKEELDKMIRNLERWTDKNLMEVNVEKTKIVVFGNGGRRKKERWNYKDRELEVVSEFNYLGFWFTATNQYNTHIIKAAGKTQQLINKVWSETNRAAITDLKRRLYFMDSTVKTVALYGVEIWGWKRRETIEKIQSRYRGYSDVTS